MSTLIRTGVSSEVTSAALSYNFTTTNAAWTALDLNNGLIAAVRQRTGSSNVMPDLPVIDGWAHLGYFQGSSAGFTVRANLLAARGNSVINGIDIPAMTNVTARVAMHAIDGVNSNTFWTTPRGGGSAANVTTLSTAVTGTLENQVALFFLATTGTFGGTGFTASPTPTATHYGTSSSSTVGGWSVTDVDTNEAVSTTATWTTATVGAIIGATFGGDATGPSISLASQGRFEKISLAGSTAGTAWTVSPSAGVVISGNTIDLPISTSDVTYTITGTGSSGTTTRTYVVTAPAGGASLDIRRRSWDGTEWV